MAKEYTGTELDAAAARCKARGVSTLYPQEWQAAMAQELGQTAAEAEQHDRDVRSAADARLARGGGEAALHAARLASKKA